MRASFFSICWTALALAAMGAPAAGAGTSVTVMNVSTYTARVTVRRDGRDLGAAVIRSKRLATIDTPIDPAGGSVAISLTLDGKPVCKIESSIPAAVTRWVVIGEAAAPGGIPKCAIRRG